LRTAKGSLLEVETQVLIAKGLEFICPSKSAQISESLTEVLRMLNGLVAALPRFKGH